MFWLNAAADVYAHPSDKSRSVAHMLQQTAGIPPTVCAQLGRCINQYRKRDDTSEITNT
jgi:hypothetical protein